MWKCRILGIMKRVLIFIILFVDMTKYVRTKNCTISTPTVQYVSVCPTDEETWKKAAKAKNCESLANFAVSEGCVNNPSDFVYHCVINHWRNATLEVCAPTRYMQYQGCYDIVKFRTTTQVTASTSAATVINPRTTKTEPFQEQVVIIGVVLVVCVVIILVIVIVLGCWIKKPKKGKRKFGEDSEEESEKNTFIEDDINDYKNQDVQIKNAHQDGAEDIPLIKRIEDIELLDNTRLEEIKAQAREHLKSYREFDEYYVETSLYKKIRNCFRENGVVIIEGSTGCGKTAAATHLLLKYYELPGIDVLKVTQFSDLYQCKSNEVSSVIFLVDDLDIDNPDMPNWAKAFEMLYIKMKESENVLHRGTQRIRLIVTAFHIPSILRNLPIFSGDFLILESELSKREKLQILRKQMKYASGYLDIKYESINKNVQKSVESASTVVGFPLAAQFYAREEKYRKKGKEFFESPKVFFKDSLKDYVENDKSKGILTALIIVYLREIYEGNGYIPDDIAVAKLVLPETCKNAIDSHIVNKLKLKYENVSNSATKLLGLFFLKTEEGTYRFCHSLVLDSVSSYLFDEYFETVVEHFPLAAIAYETHEFSDYTETQFSFISDRLIRELEAGNLEDVCKCTILKNEFILKIMNRRLQENETTLKKILTVFDCQHEHLRLTFWAGRYGLLKFSAMLLNFVDTHILNEPLLNRYFSLLGEFSLKSPRDLNNTIHNIKTSSEIRKILFAERQSFIHEIISSNRQDGDVKAILEHLVKDGISMDTLDRSKRTPLMIAVYCDKERGSTIDLLLKKSDLSKVDRKGYSVFHHCVAAEKNDQKCSLILSKLLGTHNIPTDVLNLESNSGLTVLHRAAIVTNHSRIICMQILLGFDKELCKSEMLDTTDRSPIYNMIKYLNKRSVFVELERLIRACILLLHDCSPYDKADGDEKSAWDVIKENKSGIHQKLFQLIKVSPDQEEIIEIISSVLDDLPQNAERSDVPFETLVPKGPEIFSAGLRMLFNKAAQCLCTKTFSDVQTM
ncbi:uncharacterized protein LOC134271534 isoform X2 [Saccostrea cucullata]|uniref:uncharacterized protein LOC134271534 isoform X2 n=1 Tax=Saccostrea cuccullata TaxID=36930 RepID=UPI002ED13092